MTEIWFRNKPNVFWPLNHVVPVNSKGRLYLALGCAAFVVAAVLFVTRLLPSLLIFVGWGIFGAGYGLIGAMHMDWSGNSSPPPSN